MLREVNEAKKFLIEKFGKVENVKAGTYAVPTETSKGKAFMEVVVTEEMGLKGFNLFWNEELTIDWHSSESPNGSKINK